MTGLLASAMTLFLLDQWSKRTVQLLVLLPAASGSRFVRIRRVFNINRLYRSRPMRVALVVVWLVALTSAVALQCTGMWLQGPAKQIGVGLALGGALGNLLDIVRHQSVLDFIDLRWWPVFNVADIGIVGGLLLAFCW